MKRLLIIVWSSVAIIALGNCIFYKNLYKKQINYIFELLNRQVQIVGLQVDETNNKFLSDLNQVNFEGDLTSFFTNKDNQRLAVEKMKLFFSKYQDFVTGMKYYDNNRNEFTLKQDTESRSVEWLESQPYITHVQATIYTMERLVPENRRYNYYLPVYNQKNETIGNLVVTVDFQRYFNAIFTTFNLQDYQWQWVISDSGDIIFNNYSKDIQYSQLKRIAGRLAEGSVESTIHGAVIEGKKQDIISSYYSTQLLQRDLGLVFSSQTELFQKYITRNSLFIVIGTLLLILVIICFFHEYINSQNTEIKRFRNSEEMLFRLIEEMPLGIIIYNGRREIIKANRVAAEEYSHKSGDEMEGKIFPEVSYSEKETLPLPDVGIDPDRFIVIRKATGEIVLFRKSIPVLFRGEEATMEILTDVTLLESARKRDLKANQAKSEFLARVSYEIRTPLSGITGMTDVLNKYDLSPEVREIVRLLRSSTEVLITITNDILDISKIELGDLIIQEIPFNLREEIKCCTDLARINVPPESLSLISVIEKDVPEKLVGDPFRLRQVLTYFFNNAIRNTDEGEIRLRCFLKSKKDALVVLGFELADTGKYFDKETLKNIFGDVESVESKALRATDEFTFGTSLARQLTELMGGTFAAESPSGLVEERGTKLSFTINVYLNERIEKNLNFENISDIGDIKALVISGNVRDEKTLTSLRQTGIRLTVTTFTKVTVSQLKTNLNDPQERYNLIIVFDNDSIDGFDVASALRDNRLIRQFIVIMISSEDKKGNYLKSLTMGIDSYLIRPVTVPELINTLRDHFNFTGEVRPVTVPESIGGLKILVVEDNKLNIKVIGTMLANMGYEYDVAEDGYAGFLMARSKRYDLIFMDLMLPEIDGFEASRKILKIDNIVKIVALTADILPETRRKAELTGIIDFIPKPVRIEDLKRVFSVHFNKR